MSHPVESFLRAVREVRDGGGVAETSFYPAIAALLDEAGASLSPRVRCIIHPQNRGAGIPDGGLFTADQMGVGERSLLPDDAPVPAVLPARGALEVKGVSAGLSAVVEGEQVARYLGRYGQVLVTNLREWVLVGPGEGGARELERCVVAPGEGAFWEMAAHPRRGTEERGDALMEFLRLAMVRPAPIVDPAEVAWIFACYAREARRRAEAADVAALGPLREALEEALGMRFHGSRGEHFFRSTLVQTLFYGIFAAWVLWSRGNPPAGERFDWRLSGWLLRVPAIRGLFYQIADRDRLHRLGLKDFLDRAGDALNRVDRPAFFARFAEEHAVQYFYEPFLQAFDPALRKELGVWYTPPEIVKYMVARVDAALRDELGIADGLADRRVTVLDPCCGTGAYLVGVLERIAEVLRERGEGDLVGAELRHAATRRVFGFEILPAPFVVAHLQLGLLLRALGARFEEEEEDGNGRDRVGVFLTNALSGWGPPPDEQKTLAFPELQAEHDAAEAVKRSDSILVVLGNPPYNGYPGAAIDEERDLVEAYRSTVRAPKPQGQGLNDLYVRFFRMAERRIVEMTGKGVVCFISNYSWLDGLSFTGMRERYLDVFDRIWIDSLNGDKYRTGKLTPEGLPDPSVFSTEWNREGIQVGTAIATLVRTEPHGESSEVSFREWWGRSKRGDLLASCDIERAGYTEVEPVAELGFSFSDLRNSPEYLLWPLLPQVFPNFYPRVKTSRDDFLIAVDREDLKMRIEVYLDPDVPDAEIRQRFPAVMQPTKRFDPSAVRKQVAQSGGAHGVIRRYCYRPFDLRWIYWIPETKLLDEKRPEYVRNVAEGNVWLEARQRQTQDTFDRGYVTTVLADNFGNGLSSFFPLNNLAGEHPTDLFSVLKSSSPTPNVSVQAKEYAQVLDAEVDDLFYHAVTTLHAPDYRSENAGALRQDWPRIPLPSDRVRLEASAALGRQLATLLDPEQPAPGVTTGTIRTELRPIGTPARTDGAQLVPDRDFSVTAGWGHSGKGGATMPGRGRAIERPYTDEERGMLETGAADRETSADQLYALLGETCVDVYLNDTAHWRCVPKRVWEYTLGGYQVIKKWLSYREQPLLGRPLTLDEVREVRDIARRIAAILLLEPALNEAYAATKANVWEWSERPR